MLAVRVRGKRRENEMYESLITQFVRTKLMKTDRVYFEISFLEQFIV